MLDQSAVLRTPEDARAPFAPFAHPNLPCGVTKPDWGVLIGFNHDLNISSREMSWMHGITINHDKSPGGICVHLRNWQPGIQLFAFSSYPTGQAAKPPSHPYQPARDWPMFYELIHEPKIGLIHLETLIQYWVYSFWCPFLGNIMCYIYIQCYTYIYIYDKYVIYNINIYVYIQI